MSSNEWLPAQIPFDLVRRGFAPDQVTAHLERLEYDLRIATANSDATNQRLFELTAHLSAVQAEADDLRAQLDHLALEPVSMTGLSNRMQRMIRLAEEEAAEIRARANAESDQVRAVATAATAATAAEREAFDGERERTRRQLAEQVKNLVGEATAEAENLRATAVAQAEAALTAATTEADQLLTEARNESTRAVAAARAEADSTLLAARTEATDTLTSARQEAEHTTTTARAAAEALTVAATAERERLDSEGEAYRRQVAEDFEIAISARRNEAHQRLTEREEISVADAQQRVAEATAEANRLVSEATAESERRVREATDHSAELIRQAAAESHQRVAEADQAVNALTDLRTRLLEQLDSLRSHLGQVDQLAASAPKLLDPPTAEAGRAVTDDFPDDPAGRPTDLPESYDSGEPGPWDEESSVRSYRSGERWNQPQHQPQQTEQPQQVKAAPNPPADEAATVRTAADPLEDDDAPDDGASSAQTDTIPTIKEEHLVSVAQELPDQSQHRGGFRAFAERTRTGGH
jgi:cell division septum initiation protein DivIVA